MPVPVWRRRVRSVWAGHQFRLAFEPRGPALPTASCLARAASFATPPYVVSAIGAGGALPPVGHFVSLDPLEGGLVLSACHKATTEEAMLVRLFNPDGEAARIRVASQRANPLAPRGRIFSSALSMRYQSWTAQLN